MKSKILRLTPIAAGVLAATNVAYATDPTYLLDVYDMTVGTRLGEGLIVAESCIDPADTSTTCTKTKYVTALPGRTGRIEFAINAAGAFDVSMNLDNNTSSGNVTWGETITTYSPDGSAISLVVDAHIGHPYYNSNDYGGTCKSNGASDTGGLSIVGTLVGYAGGYTSNDFRISVANAVANCYCNGATMINYDNSQTYPITLSDPQRAYNRLAVSGINDKDRLYEITVRGSTATGGGACGDVNNDNASTVVDALIVARHDIGLAVTGSCFNQ